MQFSPELSSNVIILEELFSRKVTDWGLDDEIQFPCSTGTLLSLPPTERFWEQPVSFPHNYNLR